MELTLKWQVDRFDFVQMETPVCPSKQLPDAHLIKPKVEPCEYSLSLAPDDSEDCETTPLSCNHPFFTIILSSSHVQKPFQLVGESLRQAPPGGTHLCHSYLPWESWAMGYCGNLKTENLDADYMDFCVNNRLQVNDACVPDMSAVVKLVAGTREEVVFQVQIPPHSLSEEVASNGANIIEIMFILMYTSRELYYSIDQGLLLVEWLRLRRRPRSPADEDADAKVANDDQALQASINGGIADRLPTSAGRTAASSSSCTVFELLTGTREEAVFQVQILRGDVPKKITYKGYTADEPLVIVF
ncbi:B3 domain-containing protein [Hordeum vulgare]|nr:B3 domain-containing protein [Hordeum vulgare]